MKILKVKVENWGCFTGEPVELEFSKPVTVVHASNGSGKSTMMRAISYAFKVSYTTGAKETLEAIVPRGKKISPKVDLWFSTADGEYHVHKEYGKGGACKLFKKDGGGESLIAEKSDAETELKKVLSKETGVQPADAKASKGRKVAEQELQDALWVGQSDLEGLEIKVTTAMESRFTGESGGATEGSTERFGKKIHGEFKKYYTDTEDSKTGTYREHLHSPVKILRKKKQELAGKIVEMEGLEKQAREKGEEANEKRLRLDQVAVETAAVGKSFEGDEAKIKEVEALEGELKDKSKDKELAKADFKETSHALDQLKSAAEAEKTLGQTKSGIETETGKQKNLKTELDGVTKKITGLAAGKKEIEKLKRELDDARNFVELEGEKTKTAKAVEDLKKAAGLVEQAAKLPVQKDLDGVHELKTDWEKKKTQFEASLIRLEITPEKGGAIITKAGNPGGEKNFGAGESLEFDNQGEGEVEINWEGVGTVRASGPSSGAKVGAGDVSDAKKYYSVALKKWESESIEALGVEVKKRSDLETQAGEVETAVAAALGRQVSLKDAEGALKDAEVNIAAAVQRNPVWKDSAPDPAALEKKWQDSEKNAGAELKGLESEKDKLDSALSSVAVKIAQLQGDLNVPQKTAEDWAATKGKMTAEKKDVSEIGLDKKKILAISKEDEATTAIKGILTRLNGRDSAGMKENIADARKKLDDLEKEKALLEKDFGKLEKEAIGLSNGAREDDLAKGRLEMVKIEEDFERESLRAEALALLWKTLGEEVENATQGIREAIEADVLQIVDRITAGKLAPVSLGLAKNLGAEKIKPERDEETENLDRLSGGEREQVHLAVRLAIAKLVNRRFGWPLVLDDTLEATDPERCDRIGKLILEMTEAAAKKPGQVIVFTCKKDDFRALLEPLAQGVALNEELMQGGKNE